MPAMADPRVFGTWPPKSSLIFMRLAGRDDKVVALDPAVDAEPLEVHPDRAQMRDAGARDAQRRARHGGKPDQRADLDVIRADPIAARRRACGRRG